MAVGKARVTIQRVNQEFVGAFGRQDAAGVAALYGPGAQVMPPHHEVVQGAEAIQQFWQRVMDMGVRRAVLETVELEELDPGGGGPAIELGRYTLMLADGSVADHGKYLVVWKQHDGEWKLSRDIWNSSQAQME
jgi:uncharacterized protein (TIGR02246 family)